MNSFELSQFIETSTSKYKYGNLYNLSLIGAYQIMDELDGRLQLRCEIRDKALNESKGQPNQYSFINATGGVIAFVSPQLNYSIANIGTVSLQFNFPFYKNVNSEQLTNKYSFQIGISKSVNFTNEDEISENHKDSPVEDNSKFKFIKIEVSGSCEMCKDRIESISNRFKNVQSSDWDSETKILTIYYKDNLPDILGIEKSLADAGHDNEKFKANDSVYNKLPKCCLYREK
jgi:hypothetical protein